MSDVDPVAQLAAASVAVADQLDADVYLYSGGIDRAGARQFVREIYGSINQKRGGCLLVLGTRGGDADAAYKIARAIKHHYGKFTLLIPGLCKSAGTLIAIGADELVITDDGELGPLDVQLGKRDELFEYSSGLDINQALLSLNERVQGAFSDVLLEIRQGSGGSISTKMASEIAVGITTTLYGKIYEQIDPIKLGENERAIKIAMEYGNRLKSSNMINGTLDQLVMGYPSHGFVIDRAEAETLFKFVRVPGAEELGLIASLNASLFHYLGGDRSLIQKLKSRQEAINEEHQNDGSTNDQGSRGESHRASPDSAETNSKAEGAKVAELRSQRQ